MNNGNFLQVCFRSLLRVAALFLLLSLLSLLTFSCSNRETQEPEGREETIMTEETSRLPEAEADELSFTLSDITGAWEGILSAGGQDLLIQFSIVEAEGSLTGTISIPQQNVFNHPAASVTVKEQNQVELTFPDFGSVYTGTVESSETVQSIAGVWKQGGASFKLDLKKADQQALQNKRPQDPSPPFPYEAREVTFPGGNGDFTLGGTLTVPEGSGPFPACILVSGSGQQNRDEEIFNHRPFLVIADSLTRAGIAVLRYDDRGVGSSGGNPESASTYDFSQDAAAALDFLSAQPEISSSLGVIGHSEGGLIAAILASERKDIAWIALLAAPGVTGADLLVMQSEAIMRASKMSEQQISAAGSINRRLYEIAVSSRSDEEKYSMIHSELLKAGMTGDQAENQAIALLSPWMVYFLAADPSGYLEQIQIPVLAMNGTKDLQVPYAENLEGIKKALERAGNSNITITPREGLNHLFQTADTGLVAEYALIETTFDPESLNYMRDWILDQVR